MSTTFPCPLCVVGRGPGIIARCVAMWTALALCVALAAYYRSKLARSLRRALGRRRKTPRIDESFEKMDGSLYKKFWASHQVGARDVEPFDVARPRVVLIVRGSSDDLPNLDGELDAVRACARKAAARVVECVSLETLGEALRRATSWRRDDFPCGARPRVWLHVAGHATERHLEDPQKAMVPTGKVVSLVATYRRNIEAVFCNGCRSAALAAALAEAGVAAVGWRTDCSDAGAALFAAAFYKRAFDQADAVADPNIAPAASAFLGATQDVLAPRAAAFVAQAPRSPASPTRGGGGSVDIELDGSRRSMDGSGRKGMDGSGPLSPKNTDRAVPVLAVPKATMALDRSARSARFAPEVGDVEMDGSRRAVGARRDGEMDGSRRGTDAENRAVPVLAVPKLDRSTRSARFAPETRDVEMDGSRRSVGSRRSGMDSSAASQRTSLDGSVYDLPCSLSIVDDADQVLPPEKQRKRPKLGLQRATAPRYALKDPACASVDPATGREVITTTRNAVFVESADPTDDALDFLSGLLERDAAPAPPPRRRQVAPDSTPVLRSTGGGYEVVAEGRVFGGPVALGVPQLFDGARAARAHAAAAAAETPLDRATLQGLGPKKVARLAAIGIRTVDQLARVDVDDRALVEAATHNRRFDRAVATLSKWRREAATFLRRKALGEVVPRKGRGSKRRAAAPPAAPPVVSSDSTVNSSEGDDDRSCATKGPREESSSSSSPSHVPGALEAPGTARGPSPSPEVLADTQENPVSRDPSPV